MIDIFVELFPGTAVLTQAVKERGVAVWSPVDFEDGGPDLRDPLTVSALLDKLKEFNSHGWHIVVNCGTQLYRVVPRPAP